MLSKQENRLNLYCFKLLTALGVLPLEFTESGVTLATTCRKSIWFSLMLTELCHVFLSVWLMFSKLSQNGVESIPSLTLDFIVIAAPLLTTFSSAQNFAVWPGTTKRLVSHLLDPDAELVKSQVRNGPLFGYTFLEVYVMLMALAVYPGGVAVLVAYAFNYALPLTQGLHSFIRLTMVLFEGALVFSCVSWLYFTAFIHATFLERIGFLLSREISSVR